MWLGPIGQEQLTHLLGRRRRQVYGADVVQRPDIRIRSALEQKLGHRVGATEQSDVEGTEGRVRRQVRLHDELGQVADDDLGGLGAALQRRDVQRRAVQAAAGVAAQQREALGDDAQRHLDRRLDNVATVQLVHAGNAKALMEELVDRRPVALQQQRLQLFRIRRTGYARTVQIADAARGLHQRVPPHAAVGADNVAATEAAAATAAEATTGAGADDCVVAEATRGQILGARLQIFSAHALLLAVGHADQPSDAVFIPKQGGGLAPIQVPRADEAREADLLADAHVALGADRALEPVLPGAAGGAEAAAARASQVAPGAARALQPVLPGGAGGAEAASAAIPGGARGAAEAAAARAGGG
mmetsp:Transcript_74935/g.242299  ORF Transcript_74935/g.242299 Transcript_74935/m.242299 type:complete len:359 (+) Transcript_74935:2975-4051(+)